ncbi:MAG: putative Energy-coupling factor transporter transmembrane protein EcfT [Promethearchaeota archaeon]|nr:MAG: putative Energy-coupling factor transporter transmembrane protein EcfT [Candidatus Lokiarchaeota archaeon]
MPKKNEFLDNKTYTFTYYPGDSLLHKLNPLSKLVFLLLLTILIFFIRSLILFAVITLSIILIALASGISLRNLAKKLRFIIIVMIFSVFLNIFFNAIPQEQEQVLFYLFGVQFLPIRRLAVYYAMKAFLIVITLFTSSIIYTNTTLMKDFAYSLMSLNIPYKFSFDFMVGIRYLPLIEKEAKTIALAQKARGFGREKVNSIKKAYNFVMERLISTLVSILRKGHITSISMENRCFGIYKTRTNLTKVPFKKKDYGFIIFCILLFSFISLYIFRIIPLPTFPSLYNIFKNLF